MKVRKNLAKVLFYLQSDDVCNDYDNKGDGKELKADDTDEIIVDKVHTASRYNLIFS